MYILSAAVLILFITAIALWLKPAAVDDGVVSEMRYGVHEGLQLVEQTMAHGERQYVVEDAKADILFSIPLRSCMLDTRFRNGQLRFREMSTGREGFVDKHGMVTFAVAASGIQHNEVAENKHISISKATASDTGGTMRASGKTKDGINLSLTDIRKLSKNSPFYAEAAKVLHGKLDENDASSRRQILNYCEHLRAAYTTKDIDFLRQVFSDEALIIVGNVVKTVTEKGSIGSGSRVNYALHSKRSYISRLSKVFAINKKIDVQFSDFRIMRHPTKTGIYGVSLRQRYRSDRYSDDGWLFLLWDFRNASMPVIHVRTWQPSAMVSDADGVIGIADFNLE